MKHIAKKVQCINKRQDSQQNELSGVFNSNTYDYED